MSDQLEGGNSQSGDQGVFQDPGQQAGGEGDGQQQQQQGDGGQQQQQQQGQEGQQQQQTPPPQTLTPEQIAEAINKSSLGKKLSEPAPQADPFANLSPEQKQAEFNRLFNVWEPDEPTIKALLAGGPDALRAVASMRDAISKQAVTMASYLVSQLKEELDGRLTPIQGYYAEQQTTKLYEKFYESNADLKPYDAIVRAVVDQMKAGGAKFSSHEEAFKELATRVKATMKSIPGLDPTKVGQGDGKQNPNGQPGKMPTLSRGGQGGTGRGSQSQPTKTAGMAVFS